MKVYIGKDEAYPVYWVDTDLTWHSGEFVEIPAELYARYKAVGEEYEKVQEELAKYSCE